MPESWPPKDYLLDELRRDTLSRGGTEADVVEMWDAVKRKGATVTLHPTGNAPPATPELDELYKEAPTQVAQAQTPPSSSDLDELYKETPVPKPAAPAPTGRPVAPSGVEYPEKSTLDRAIGTVGRGFYEYSKGLTGPVWQGLKFLGHDIPDWFVQLGQNYVNPDVPLPGEFPINAAGAHIMDMIQNEPQNLTDLLGPTAEGIRKEGWTYPFQSPERVGAAVGDTLSNLFLLGPLSKAGQLAKGALPARAGAAIDRGIGKVIPKYNFPDQALAAEAAREGQYLAGSAKTEALTRSAKTLMEQEPGAAPFLAPKIAAPNMKRFQKTYEQHELLGPPAPGQAHPGWIPFDYKSRNLELSVDTEGRISYLRQAEFNALPPDVQHRIGEIRNAVDANTRLLNDMGIVSDAKAIPGYLAKKYSAFEQSKVWQKKLENTTSGQMAVAEAKDYISRKTGITNDAILNQAIQDILDPKFKETYQRVGPREYSSLGDWQRFAQNLAKRKNLPPEIEKILGPMEGAEHMPYRVGYTLDAQLKMITNHQALDSFSRLTANGGQPLIYTGPLRPPGYIPIPKDEIFGKWGGAFVHKDVADILPTLQGNTTNNFLSRYMTAWKASKTSWSPSTHLNNVMGDVIFAHLAGANPLNPLNTRYYKQAAEELMAYLSDPSKIPSPAVAEALGSGGIRPGFAGTELKTLANRIRGLAPEQTAADAALGVLTDNKVAQKLRDIYDAEDQVFRYAAYLKHRANGLSAVEASAEVNKYFPSYATSSPVGRYLRGQGHWTGNIVGSPFTSFPLEATRIYATAAREKPWRLAAVGAMPLSLTAMNLGNSGMSIEDWHRMLDNLPSHLKGRTLIPMVGPDGQIEVADWSNILPLGNWAQSGESMAESGPARDVMFGGPAWNALKIAFNTDFAGHKLYDTSHGDSYVDMLKMTAQQAAPAPQWFLNLLPLGESRVEKAIEGVPPRRNAPDEETIPQAAWRSIFPNLSAKDIAELEKQARVNRKGEMNELKKGKGFIKNPSMTPPERERRRDNILDELYNRRER